MDLPTAVPNGTCGDHNIGTMYLARVAASDDDYKRAESVYYCFIGNTPLFKKKVYTSAADEEGITLDQAVEEGIPVARSLAPEHQRITQTMTTFLKVDPGTQPTSVFYPPSSCTC